MSDLIDSIIEFVQMLMVAALPLAFLIWILLGFKRGSDYKKRRKKLLRKYVVQSFLLLSLCPLLSLLGEWQTDAPTSTMIQFWQGFFFIEGIPLLCLLLTVIKRFKQAKV